MVQGYLTFPISLQITNKSPPPTVVDQRQATLSLHSGEFAILHMQFRVGDGDRIQREGEALVRLRAFILPFMLPDAPTDNSSTADATSTNGSTPMPGASYLPPPVRALFTSDPHGTPGMLTICSEINLGVVCDYYGDLYRRDDDGDRERAFLESHYGRARTEIWERKRERALHHAEQVLRAAERSNPGRLDQLAAMHARETGNESIAQVTELLRRRVRGEA